MAEPSPVLQSMMTHCEAAQPHLHHNAVARSFMAAILRIVANGIRFQDHPGMTAYGGHAQAQRQILDIANELEAGS